MRRHWTVVIGLGCGLLGLGIGRVSARDTHAPERVESKTNEVAAAPKPLRPKGMFCTSRTPDLEAAGCASERLRNQWCEGQLAQCEHAQQANRQPWPEDEGVEGPEAWANAVEEALDDCEITDAEVETIECSEYPCVAALRPTIAGEPDDPAFSAAQERLIESVRGCAPLREAFGIDDPTSKALDVFSNDTTCPDGSRRDFFALMALDPNGPAYELLDEERKRSKREERDLFRWLFRRGDDIAAVYPCDP